MARSLHPSRARELIAAAAAETVAGAAGLATYLPGRPYALEVDVVNTSVADVCSLVPGVHRTGPRTLAFTTDDFREAFRCLLAWTYLGMSEAPRYAGT